MILYGMARNACPGRENLLSFEFNGPLIAPGVAYLDRILSLHSSSGLMQNR